MTALDIMTQVRERLGDEKKQRWSDNRLLSIVSQGQVDICIESGFLRREVIIPLINNESIYQLPSNCITVKRVEYNDLLLPLFARGDQDIPRVPTADYTALKSNINMDKLEIVPAPTDIENDIAYIKGDLSDDSFQVSPLYGVVTRSSDPVIEIVPLYGATTGVTLDVSNNEVSDKRGEIAGQSTDVLAVETPSGNYGVVVTMAYTLDSDKYGFISSVADHEVSGYYGISTNVAKLANTFKVYYVAAPVKLQFKEAILILPNIWEDLLMRYVVGTALQDDNDANNIQRGELEIAKYEKKLKTISDMSAKDYSAGASDKFQTEFRRI